MTRVCSVIVYGVVVGCACNRRKEKSKPWPIAIVDESKDKGRLTHCCSTMALASALVFETSVDGRSEEGKERNVQR